jgi:hypothetical protein
VASLAAAAAGGAPREHAALPPRARITHHAGVNNNAYQITRALHHNKNTGQSLDTLSRYVKADFMNMPFDDASFDAIYQIDATCHAPDQVGCYKVRPLCGGVTCLRDV